MPFHASGMGQGFHVIPALALSANQERMEQSTTKKTVMSFAPKVIITSGRDKSRCSLSSISRVSEFQSLLKLISLIHLPNQG